jgi:hypothetical protein
MKGYEPPCAEVKPFQKVQGMGLTSLEDQTQEVPLILSDYTKYNEHHSEMMREIAEYEENDYILRSS